MLPVAGTITALSPILGGLFQLIDSLYTTDEERAEARLKVMSMDMQGALGQMAINAKEAESRSMFVAGWRPAVGWICVFAFAWQFVLLPLFTSLVGTVAAYNGVEVSFDTILQLDATALMPLLFGMLGIGGLRSFEKIRGVAAK